MLVLMRGVTIELKRCADGVMFMSDVKSNCWARVFEGPFCATQHPPETSEISAQLLGPTCAMHKYTIFGAFCRLRSIQRQIFIMVVRKFTKLFDIVELILSRLC